MHAAACSALEYELLTPDSEDCNHSLQATMQCCYMYGCTSAPACTCDYMLERMHTALHTPNLPNFLHAWTMYKDDKSVVTACGVHKGHVHGKIKTKSY